jgi:hypothetical protein
MAKLRSRIATNGPKNFDNPFASIIVFADDSAMVLLVEM